MRLSPLSGASPAPQTSCTGQADLVCENTTAGERGIWIMQNGVHTSTCQEALSGSSSIASDHDQVELLSTGTAGLQPPQIHYELPAKVGVPAIRRSITVPIEHLASELH